MRQRDRRLLKDLLIVLISLIVAVWITRLGFVGMVTAHADGWYPLTALIVGMFFTSVFTTAPATVILGTLALTGSPWIIAACGAVGALFGDALIFRFFTDHLSEDFMYLLEKAGTMERLKGMADTRAVRWLLPLLGTLIIASPLPDELGIAILGLSHMPNRLFVPLSYSMNFLGILFICVVARSLIMRT